MRKRYARKKYYKRKYKRYYKRKYRYGVKKQIKGLYKMIKKRTEVK